MGLTITANDVRELTAGVWQLNMPPHQVRLLGSPTNASGERSVVLLEGGHYDQEARTLTFDLSDAAALNVGTQPETIFLLSKASTVATGTEKRSAAALAGGDREFLNLVRSELPLQMQRAAERLLKGVRSRYPGELKRGQSRNFSETPDNFWYVIVQPRVGELSITVRGTVDHFAPVAKLEIKDDRGNTRFKVRSEADVDPALDLIFHARRR